MHEVGFLISEFQPSRKKDSEEAKLLKEVTMVRSKSMHISSEGKKEKQGKSLQPRVPSTHCVGGLCTASCHGAPPTVVTSCPQQIIPLSTCKILNNSIIQLEKEINSIVQRKLVRHFLFSSSIRSRTVSCKVR